MGTCMIPNCRKNTARAEPFCAEHTDIEDRDPTYQKRYEAALRNWDVEVNDLKSKLDAAEKALNQPVLLSEWQQQQALLASALKAAGLFASVIKSGESWTEHCQAAFDEAFPEAPK